MENEGLARAYRHGNPVTGSTEALFSGRARWVQKWISGTLLPFTALLGLALSYWRIGSGEIRLPDTWNHILGVILLCIVISRATIHAWRGRWIKSFGNYQVCLGYLALLLLLGDIDGEHSLIYWGAMLIGFWGTGYVYPKRFMMPGEFTAIALMSTCVVLDSNPPLPGWLFVLVMVAPLMVYLQLKHQLLKPVLFLAALLVGVMIISDIRGWQIILAVLAALALLWVAIYSIGKLSQTDASSFIQSVGVGVISGLLFAIFTGLIGLSPEAPLTWWMMFGSFSVIAGFLHARNAGKLYQLLILWGTHWALITFTISWEEWFPAGVRDGWYGFQVGAVMGSLLLLLLSIRFNNNRLLVWGRIYLMLVALTILIGDEPLTLYHLTFVLALFAYVIWSSKPRHLATGPPWWRGVVNPRHVVAARRILRKSGNAIASIPFIGATASALIKTVQVLANLKQPGNKFSSGDVLLIVWVTSLAIYISGYYDLIFHRDDVLDLLGTTTDSGEEGFAETDEDVIASQSAYLVAGFLFGVISVKERQPLYLLLAMVSFLLAPVTIMTGEYFDTTFFWLISLIAATGILSVWNLNSSVHA